MSENCIFFLVFALDRRICSPGGQKNNGGDREIIEMYNIYPCIRDYLYLRGKIKAYLVPDLSPPSSGFLLRLNSILNVAFSSFA